MKIAIFNIFNIVNYGYYSIEMWFYHIAMIFHFFMADFSAHTVVLMCLDQAWFRDGDWFGHQAGYPEEMVIRDSRLSVWCTSQAAQVQLCKLPCHLPDLHSASFLLELIVSNTVLFVLLIRTTVPLAQLHFAPLTTTSLVSCDSSDLTTAEQPRPSPAGAGSVQARFLQVQAVPAWCLLGSARRR